VADFLNPPLFCVIWLFFTDTEDFYLVLKLLKIGCLIHFVSELFTFTNPLEDFDF
jgi:hypothetical protein